MLHESNLDGIEEGDRVRIHMHTRDGAEKTILGDVEGVRADDRYLRVREPSGAKWSHTSSGMVVGPRSYPGGADLRWWFDSIEETDAKTIGEMAEDGDL